MRLLAMRAFQICGIVIFAGLPLVSRSGRSLQAEPAVKISGTYTNMQYQQEAGDLLGIELKIVPARKGYQGALQFAEGEPSDLIVVEIRLEGESLSFSIRSTSGHAGQFVGNIKNGILHGQFRFTSGVSEDVTLKKGKSYWASIFTDIHYDREARTLAGTELKIVGAKRAYQGALQFAEGGPGDLVVVQVKIASNKIDFSVPDTDVHAGEFSGVVENGLLHGQFRLKNGVVEAVSLKKGMSYWD